MEWEGKNLQFKVFSEQKNNISAVQSYLENKSMPWYLKAVLL